MITNDVENTWCQIEWLGEKGQVSKTELGYIAHAPTDLFDTIQEHPMDDKVYWWLDTADWNDLVSNKTITIPIGVDDSLRISIRDNEPTINDIKRELEESSN